VILLIDNYDSFTFNLYQYIEELGARCKVLRNDAIDLAGVRRLKPAGIVLSPGPGDPSSSGVCLDVLKEMGDKTPILGVCLGHQAIGLVFGGRVGRAKTLMHGKLSDIHHGGKGVFRGLPNPFPATRYHSLVIEEQGFPSCLEVTARTKDGVIMGVRHKKLKIEGVQFHPESYMTEGGKGLLSNFLRSCR